MPSPATANAPTPAAIPSPISRKRITTSFGSSTGVRNRMMLAAPRCRTRARLNCRDHHHHRTGYTEQDLRLPHQQIHRCIRHVGPMHDRHNDADERRGGELEHLLEGMQTAATPTRP